LGQKAVFHSEKGIKNPPSVSGRRQSKCQGEKLFIVKIEQSDTGFYTGLFVDSGNIPFQSSSGNIQAFSDYLNAVLCIDKTAEHLSFSFRERKHF